MVFDRSLYVIPPAAIFKNGVVGVEGDVVIADRCEVLLGIRTPARVFMGELVKIRGNIEAEGDIRIDRSSVVTGNITSSSKAYLGERTKISGKLMVEGDLDIGEDVEIAPESIEAHGWVNIRNPIPTVIYLIIYLLELLRRGESEEVEKILAELEAENPEDFLVTGNFLYLPVGSRLTRRTAQIKGGIRVGTGAQVRGNLNATKNILVGEGTEVLGNIISGKDIAIRERVVVEGSLRSRGDVEIDRDVHITGDVDCLSLKLHTESQVDGTLFARQGIRFVDDTTRMMEERVKRFETGLDELDTALG